MILYALYKKHHWLVAGPTFYQLHLLFDKHAEEQTELIDLLAERVQSLGGIAVGDPRHAAELTTIDRPPNGAEDVPAMIHRTLERPRDHPREGPGGDRQDREELRLGLERPADGRRPAPARVAGLVHRRARRRRAADRRLGARRRAAFAAGPRSSASHLHARCMFIPRRCAVADRFSARRVSGGFAHVQSIAASKASSPDSHAPSATSMTSAKPAE